MKEVKDLEELLEVVQQVLEVVLAVRDGFQKLLRIVLGGGQGTVRLYSSSTLLKLPARKITNGSF